MSERNEEIWAEMERLSRRMALQYQECLTRIFEVEAEVEALKASRSDALPQMDARTVYQDARPINWCDDGAAQAAIDEIMDR